MSTESPEAAERPLRADAARNRQKVLAAARIAFAEGGSDVAVSEILKLAGVGSGTLFRHFETKRDLLLAVLEQTLDEFAATVDQAIEAEDPWEGLVAMLTATAEVQARDQAFLQSVGPELFGEESLLQRNQAMMARMDEFLTRAKAAGAVRDDLSVVDLPFVMSAIGGATQHCAAGPAAGTSPDLWRRYLGIVLDGLRPQGATPLAAPAPTVEQLMAMKAEGGQQH